MIIKKYIKDFKKMGFGMFVHFGIYSLIGKGEWVKECLSIADDEYNPLYKELNPKKEWARELVKVAKTAGCKYITLTARHHDGFSLYDTYGLTDFDAVHGCGRDLVKEFVDACHEEDITPFFYHTLLDWYEASYKTDFNTYLAYLRQSVELLCKNYGKIGGLWFDGMWDRPDDDWQEDELYATIRRHQPEAMIINNTGLDARGQLGHIELDSVTFERGNPTPINREGSAKYIASEMCQVFADHWGYARKDLNYKSTASIIEDFASCRRYGSNFLLNVGPMGDGSLRLIDKAMLELVGKWATINSEALHIPRPTDIKIKNKEKDFILVDKDTYYLFVHDLPMIADANVALASETEYLEIFSLDKNVKEVAWVDDGTALEFSQAQNEVKIVTQPYSYGENTVVRVVKIKTE